MKKCLIICWYGKFPSYYKLWEYSCSKNKNYDFLVFTDQEYKSEYKNIKIINKSLKEINELFSNKINTKINITKPYKFCDFRPLYGVLFEDYIKQYKYWGHCDIDQIFGNLDKYIIDNEIKQYEKINFQGHFTLYKNTKKINELYKKNGSSFNYKEVIKSDNNYAFDEISGIDKIAEENKIKTLNIKKFADIDPRYKRYKIIGVQNYNHQYFKYKEGRIFFVYENNGIWQEEEKMYIHFQKKKPIIKLSFDYDDLIIGSSGIMENLNDNFENYQAINKYEGFVYENLEKIKYYLNKILKFISINKAQKKIWLKQKSNNYKG